MTVITFIQHDGSKRMVDGNVGLSLMETALKHDVPELTPTAGGCHLWHLPASSRCQDRQRLTPKKLRCGAEASRAENSRLVPDCGFRRYG